MRPTCWPRHRQGCRFCWSFPGATGTVCSLRYRLTTPGETGLCTGCIVPLVHQVAGYVTDRLPGTGRVQITLAGRGAGQSPGVTIEAHRALVRNVDPEESDVERTTLAKLRERTGCPIPR